MATATAQAAPIVLELTAAEAVSLLGLTALIGGSGPARAHVDNIYFALEEVGVVVPDNTVTLDGTDISGGDE